MTSIQPGLFRELHCLPTSKDEVSSLLPCKDRMSHNCKLEKCLSDNSHRCRKTMAMGSCRVSCERGRRYTIVTTDEIWVAPSNAKNGRALSNKRVTSI